MKGYHIAAIVSSFLSLAVIGSLIYINSSPKDRKMLLLIFLAMSPMCPLVFHYLRMPLDNMLIKPFFIHHKQIYQFLYMLYAPLTEEPAKLWIFIIPWFYKQLSRSNVIITTMTIGLGFGLGETWLVASFIAGQPNISNLPWYFYTGYIFERSMVCATHGIMSLPAISTLHSKKFILGILGSMSLHLLGNLPIYLARINFASLGNSFWKFFLNIWLQIYVLFLLAILLMYKFNFQSNLLKSSLKKINQSKCPECFSTYLRPIIGINLLNKRYERCPYCKKYHLVDVFWKEYTQ